MENNIKLELFTGAKGSVAVSLSKPGMLSFSAGAHNEMKLFNYQSVQLFFGKNDNVIAIKFYKDATVENSIKLSHRKAQKGCFVNCKSFVSEYKLEEYLGRRFEPEIMNHADLGEIIIIKLSEKK